MSNITFQFNQTIFVSREGADSRSKAVNMIKERVGTWSLQEIKLCFNLSWRSFHPSLGHSLLFGLKALALTGNQTITILIQELIIFGLGKHWCSSSLALSFLELLSSQSWSDIMFPNIWYISYHCVILLAPVCYLQDTVTWTWDQPYGALTCIFLSLSQWSLR